MSVTEGLPRLIFCLSPGRCGTKYLAALLSTIPGVYSVHEAEPDFVDWARAARRDPQEAWRFWHCEKLPYIRSLDCEVYVETSHLFGKGFVKPLLDLGVVPDVIVLDRVKRDVALSYWRRGSIPAKTLAGQRYLLHPEQAEYCPLPRWWTFTDYQLCYWYAMEMERRMEERTRWIQNAGGNVYYLNFGQFTGNGIVKWIDDNLDLPPINQGLADQIHQGARNATPPSVQDRLPPGNLDELEQQVWVAIDEAQRNPPPPDPRQKVDVIVLTMTSIHKELASTLLALSRQTHYNITVGFAAANPTSNNRCQIAKEFVDNERRPDWLMMIDEDTVPSGDFLRFTESTYDVLSFVTPCWKPATNPDCPVVWNIHLDEDTKEFVPIRSGMLYELSKEYQILDVASAGSGAILIRREVLEHPDLRAPFKDEFNEYGIRIYGHDLRFCERARAAGFKVGSVLLHPASHYKMIDLIDVARLMGRRDG